MPERQAAVAAVSGRTISGRRCWPSCVPVSGFVVQEVQIVPPDASDDQATTLPTQMSFVFVGTAAAIDTRGYYLTAAHVVSTTPVSIAVSRRPHDGGACGVARRSRRR